MLNNDDIKIFKIILKNSIDNNNMSYGENYFFFKNKYYKIKTDHVIYLKNRNILLAKNTENNITIYTIYKKFEEFINMLIINISNEKQNITTNNNTNIEKNIITPKPIKKSVKSIIKKYI